MKDKWRRVFAVAFLLFLLAEWGSHSVIETGHVSADAPSISANDVPHGDTCDYRIICRDNSRDDQRKSNLGREATQHGFALDMLSDISRGIRLRDASRIDFSSAHALFRAISPPFHPPEIS